MLELERQLRDDVPREVDNRPARVLLREQLCGNHHQELGGTSAQNAKSASFAKRLEAGRYHRPCGTGLEGIDRLNACRPLAERDVATTSSGSPNCLEETHPRQHDIKRGDLILDTPPRPCLVKERLLRYSPSDGWRGSRAAHSVFVGPPGVGKTSLGCDRPALKRKFVRVSLGGVRDDRDSRDTE